MVVIDENIAGSSGQEYDTGEDPLGNLFEQPPDVYEQVEYLENDQSNDADNTSSATVKEEGTAYNLEILGASLDNDTSNTSDCVITGAYTVHTVPEDEYENINDIWFCYCFCSSYFFSVPYVFTIHISERLKKQ